MNEHNGVGWYLGLVVGLRPAGRGRRSASPATSRLRQRRGSPPSRHTGNNALNQGYRCGANQGVGANSSGCHTRDAPAGVALGARGFGHHGNCETFNDCGDGATCANAACAHEGFGPAISWDEGLLPDGAAGIPGFSCDLFNQLPGDLEVGWGPAASAATSPWPTTSSATARWPPRPTRSCANNPLWQPVGCQTVSGSGARTGRSRTLADAEVNQTL
ncbi:MAG: hypothetical protein R3F60_33720 [bacterium]